MILLDPAAIDALIEHAQRDPYDPLPGYMHRWWLSRPVQHGGATEHGARVHQILRSDTGRHLHDHPFDSTSIILRGCYYEETPVDQSQPCSLDSVQKVTKCHSAGDVVHRRAEDRHRLILPPGKDCWSLFLVGPKRREWGFHVPQAPGEWVHWKEYERHWQGVAE